MKSFEKLAVEFTTTLVEERWQEATRFLCPVLKKEYTSVVLKERFYGMFDSYAAGPATKIHFDSQFSMEDWPTKEDGDIGWAYVGIEGDEFMEAVTVVVRESTSGLEIRMIEWGRP